VRARARWPAADAQVVRRTSPASVRIGPRDHSGSGFYRRVSVSSPRPPSLSGKLGVCREFVGSPCWGSLLTEKSEPKDVDLLVWIDESVELQSFARLARTLQGRLQSCGRGADVFLADERGEYLGRTCPWKECRPGLRVACDAQHCGRRPHLHDDTRLIRLAPDLVRTPPLELWPEVIRRCAVPAHVEGMLARLQDAA